MRGELVRCDASPIYDDEGRIVAGFGIYKDITERRRTEEHLAQYARLRENTLRTPSSPRTKTSWSTPGTGVLNLCTA